MTTALATGTPGGVADLARCRIGRKRGSGMDDQRFDAWTRRFATRSSRRRFLSRLGATLAGGFGASLIERPVPANAACPPDQVQRRGIGCVCKATGRPPDAATGECPCPDGQIRCGGVCVDPTRDMANCGSCVVTCPSSTDPCLVAACRKGVCTTVPAKIGTPCDDGNGCTANDVCHGDG